MGSGFPGAKNKRPNLAKNSFKRPNFVQKKLIQKAKYFRDSLDFLFLQQLNPYLELPGIL